MERKVFSTPTKQYKPITLPAGPRWRIDVLSHIVYLINLINIQILIQNIQKSTSLILGKYQARIVLQEIESSGERGE